MAILLPLLLACRNGGGGPTADDTDAVDETSGLAYGADCSGDPAACANGLACAGDGICRTEGEAGTAAEGTACTGSSWCQLGLVCDRTGLCAEPGGPGTAGVGETCGGDSDCQLFLSCSDETNTCYGYQPPLWTGASCEDPDLDTGPFRLIFEVPFEGTTLADFYRLPFPNDVRIEDGAMSLDGHPTPGALIPELGDVAAEVLSLLEAEATGWGSNQTAFLRFSDTLDVSTLSLGAPGEGTVSVVNVTASSDDYGVRHAGGYTYHSSREQYICHNWLALDVGGGWPYEPGETYAAIVTTGIKRKSTGESVAADADFTPLLSDSAPGSDRLGHAWEVYAPLRQYLDDFGIDPATIAGAAVFTVADPHPPLPALRDAVYDADAPVADGLHLCAGDAGPYADADDDTRGCPSPAATDWNEIQGEISLPRFQAGTPPYKTTADGGGIDFEDGPTVEATETVVFSLTIPRNAAMPADGWPVVVYGHGTNGNYRSFVEEGVADLLSHVVADDGRPARFAILSIDAVNHGTRRHSENWDSEWLARDPAAYDADVLFFNPLNPRAARDNALQSAADAFALVRWLSETSFTTGTSPTGAAIRFDPDHLYYLGHSQGAETGVGFVAFEPGVRAAVFSGGGGVIAEALAHKTKPYDLPAILSVGLADPNVDENHPLVQLASVWADPSDAVNHGAYVAARPEGDNEPKSVLQIYGVGDSYTPDASQNALARALGVHQVTHGNTEISGVAVTTPPVSDNRYDRTLVVSLYDPAGGKDGHFVVFDDESAQRVVAQFLATDFLDGMPVVVE